MKTIKVSQTASEKFEPDTLIVEIRFNAESKKHSEASDLLRKQSDGAMRLLAAAGLSDGEIKSRGVSVSSYKRDGKTIFCAYENCRISLAVSDKRTDAVTEAVEKSGAEWSCQYRLEDRSYRNALIKRAVSEARDSAVQIADAAGVKLGGLAGVEYAAQFGGGARLMRAAAFGADNVSASPEQIEISESVTCECEIFLRSTEKHRAGMSVNA